MFNINNTPNIKNGSVEQIRSEIKKYFIETIALEDSLFQLLKTDVSFYQKPESLRHPLIFYFGHTLTFYINKLYTRHYINKRVDPLLESIFAVGVDEMSWDDLDEKNYDWPSVTKVREYRKEVELIVLDYIDSVNFTVPIDWNSNIWPILMGIEHHRIHIETSSVLIRQLDLKYIQQQEQWQPCSENSLPPENLLLPVSAEPFQIGKSFQSSTYGWDNEYGLHSVSKKSFYASKFLVSNQEFKVFWESGGYQKDEFWTPEGKEWKNFKKALHPVFWVLNSQNQPTHLRTIDRIIEMPWSWPAEVNYLEAKAFCQWKSKTTNKIIRLPTEDEWYSLLNTTKTNVLSMDANIGLKYFPSSCPVNKFQHHDFFDVIGNVWQWSETPIYPFHGFKVHPLYDDFSVPTFDSKHNLIKGGSWISTGNLAAPGSRYAFRRHFFQHAGFRYVNSDEIEKIEMNPYETDTLLSQYCEFHYGNEYHNTPLFPKNCIELIRPYYSTIKLDKALDLGCALGRSTLELALDFKKTIGIDFSVRFIDRAKTLLDEGVLRYGICSEGELLDYHERSLEDIWDDKKAQILKQKYKNGYLEFLQDDACNLQSKFSEFDLVFAGNLIDRLYSPRIFLAEIKNRIVPGGILVLTSPYTWLEEFTKKNEWLGGYRKNAENFTSLQGLKEELDPHFDMIAAPQKIPFVIRETQNKYQHSFSEMTVWKKR